MLISRRSAITGATAGLAAPLSPKLARAQAPLKGRIRHSVCKWCYPKSSVEELCQAAKSLGLSSIELLGPKDWPTLARYGLTCAMASAPPLEGGLGGITRSFNRTEHHDRLVQAYGEYIPLAAAAGLPNVICFSGNRDGLPDDKGLENCALGVKRLMPVCEKHKVNLVMELLNSKVNHKDYQCDRTEWGVELCRRVGSERFKLLYDIYHMQIMEGDVIATIRKYHPFIAHYHTGGVPGRHEIDETQELYYPVIMKAIVETGFQGYVAQEFVPAAPDPLSSLAKCIRICDV